MCCGMLGGDVDRYLSYRGQPNSATLSRVNRRHPIALSFSFFAAASGRSGTAHFFLRTASLQRCTYLWHWASLYTASSFLACFWTWCKEFWVWFMRLIAYFFWFGASVVLGVFVVRICSWANVMVCKSWGARWQVMVLCCIACRI